MPGLGDFSVQLEYILIDRIGAPDEPVLLEERMDRPVIPPALPLANDGGAVGVHDGGLRRPRPRPEGLGVPGFRCPGNPLTLRLIRLLNGGMDLRSLRRSAVKLS